MAKPNDSNIQSKPLFERRFRGYDASEVDAFLERVLKEVAQLQIELAEAKTAQAKSAAEVKSLTQQCVGSAMELGKMRVSFEERTREAEELREEVKRMSERMASTDEILRAAHSAAEKMRADAQRQATDIVEDAESRAARAIEEMRARMNSLQTEMNAMKAKYRQFLDDAKELTQAMQRQISQSSETDLR